MDYYFDILLSALQRSLHPFPQEALAQAGISAPPSGRSNAPPKASDMTWNTVAFVTEYTLNYITIYYHAKCFIHTQAQGSKSLPKTK